MRKIIVFSMITLDGVMQAPGASDEDTAEGFKWGGWSVPFANEDARKIVQKELSGPYDLLLGRVTYDIFRRYWPNESGAIADPFNAATKYVVSDGPVELTWKESVLIDGDVVAKIKELKAGDGPALQVHGSGKLIQTLLKEDLIDELKIRLYPVTIGTGKRLFAEGTVPAGYKLVDSYVSKTGVFMGTYHRDGEVKTGSFA